MSEFNPPEGHVLGSEVSYPEEYSPDVLYPIPRALSRQNLEGVLDFYGEDIWTAYEISWLTEKGKPCVAVADIALPATSDNIIESKSLKLYLNSLNQRAFKSVDEVQLTISEDLSRAAGGSVEVTLFESGKGYLNRISEPEGVLLDELDIAVTHYSPAPELLRLQGADGVVEEVLYSHLLKSNCPVTGQPDWASVEVRYRGQPIDREGLLRYIISFRGHQDFHEHCVERMFQDIKSQCKPERLSVYARYTRRGGLDINPFRSTESDAAPRVRWIRQ